METDKSDLSKTIHSVAEHANQVSEALTEGFRLVLAETEAARCPSHRP